MVKIRFGSDALSILLQQVANQTSVYDEKNKRCSSSLITFFRYSINNSVQTTKPRDILEALFIIQYVYLLRLI
jgi:hypothetical protein